MSDALTAEDRDLTPHELVRTYLRDRERRMYPKLELGDLEHIVAALGQGVDHIDGEQVLAQLAFGDDTRGGCLVLLAFVANVLNPIAWMIRAGGTNVDWEHGAIFTDRRMIARDWVEAVDAPYEAITDVSYSGGFGAFFGWEFLKLAVHGDRFSIAAPAHRAMGKFLVVMSEEAREARVAHPDVHRVVSRQGDPTGAIGASAAIHKDWRAETLFKAILAQHEAGKLTRSQSLGMSQQVWLHSQTTTGARGSSVGFWISPLSREELLAFLGTQLGRAVPVDAIDGSDTFQFDKDKDYARSELGSVLLTGHFEVRLPRGDVRLQLADMDGPAGRWTGYRLTARVLGVWAPFNEVRASSLFKLHKMLLKYEGRLLLRKVLFPERDPFDVPVSEVKDRLTEVVPGADYRVFRQSRRQLKLKTMVKEAPPTKALKRGQVPARLPRPKGKEPAAISATGMMHLGAGLVTTALLPVPICCGGTVVLAQISENFLEPVLGMPDEIGALMLLMLLADTAILMFVLGPIRMLTAMAYLAAPRSMRPLMLMSSGIGVLGGVFGDLPGAAASALTLLLLQRQDVREYYDID